MTLCIAHKVNGKIILASDSRITMGNLHSDYAIKVVPINITISSARDATTGSSTTLYDSTLGLAFAGSFAAQNAIKEFLSIALQKLQFIQTLGHLSFERICNYIMDLYKHISNKLYKEIQDGNSIDFFLCGACPLLKENKVAKFHINYGENYTEFEPQYSLHDSENDFPLALGSGADRFVRAYNSIPESNAFYRAIKAVKSVIDDQSIPSVGGNIQYGEIEVNSSFSVKGIVVPELHDDGSPKLNHFFLGGIDVHDDVFQEMNGLLMTGTFIRPFS